VALGEAEQEFLFRHRYLLADVDLTAAGLRPKLEALLDGLRSAASPLLARFGFADPTGAFLGLAATWLGESRIATVDGAWFAPQVTAGGPARVLLVARGRGAGLDAPAQREAMAAFRSAFAAANPPAEARLLLSGPGVFAAEAATSIERDVTRISLAATLLLAAFLFWRFRSVLLLALVAVPLLAALLAGYAATVAIYGHVHAIALGFGVTMLGVAVDYPLLLLTLRRDGEPLDAAARRIWPTLRLAAAAAALGLLAMLGSGLPGLVQTAVFGGVGLLAAAATTRWVLPRLVPADARMLARPLPGWVQAALAALRGRRGLALAVLALAAGLLLATGGPAAQRDLAALSPVPAAQQALDGELRRQLGAPDVRSLFVIGPAGSEAEMLRMSETLASAVQPLVAQGLLAGLDLPSRYLPSLEAQRARQAALPDTDTLAAALREASAGLPFRDTAFRRFAEAVEATRALPVLDAAALAEGAPTIAARLDPLVTRHGDAVWGIAPATGVTDPPALEHAAAGLGLPGVLFLDVKLEMDRLLAGYGRATLGWALAGGVLVAVLLALGLGSARRAVAVAAPILGAVLVALAVLTLAGEAVSLFHLAALLLLAGLAIDYALFLTHADDAAEPC
jgi:predicted exporter